MRVLTPTEVSRLGDLFRRLGWPLLDNGKASERFEAFEASLAELDPQEAELVLTITNDFFSHDTGLYSSSTDRLAALIDSHLGQDGRLLVGLPLIKPKDMGKPKSAGMALYLLRIALERMARRRTWKFKTWDRYDPVPRSLPDRVNAAILLVDDFVGSGESASTAVAHFRATFSNATDQVVVCCLVAQEQAIARLNADGVTVQAVHVRRRGISDSTRLTDIGASLVTMDAIERSLGVQPDYTRGFGRAEALVAMVRCPNNTFPFYWMSHRRGAPRLPPFPR